MDNIQKAEQFLQKINERERYDPKTFHIDMARELGEATHLIGMLLHEIKMRDGDIAAYEKFAPSHRPNCECTSCVEDSFKQANFLAEQEFPSVGA